MKRQINFMGHRPLVEDTRIGICQLCGKQGETVIHHIQYDPDDPLAHTVELCHSCHTSLHRKARNRKPPYNHSFLI